MPDPTDRDREVARAMQKRVGHERGEFIADTTRDDIAAALAAARAEERERIAGEAPAVLIDHLVRHAQGYEDECSLRQSAAAWVVVHMAAARESGIADEREACAKIADDLSYHGSARPRMIAAQIRARGQA